MSGITATGFVSPTFEEVVDEINQDLLTNLDPGLDLSSESPLGQIVAVFARQIVLTWQAVEAAYGVVDPNKAEGVNLDNVCALSGTARKPATYGDVPVTLNLDAATTVPAGTIFAVTGSPTSQFALDADVTSVLAGNYAGTATCTVTGPVVANAGTLEVIVAPVSGLNSVTNASDAEIGRNIETDAELRIRREAELTLAGSATADAIRADLLAVAGVLQVKVYENPTNAVDADGVPAHAFESVIWDGDTPEAANADIVEAIWGAKPAGIQAYGTTSVSHTDESGNVVVIGFTRSTAKNVYIDITVTTDSTFDAVNGPAAIKQLLVDRGNQLQQGDDVVALVLRAAALAQPGVTDAPVFELGFSASPSGTANLSVGTREIARFDTARITVTVA